MGEEKPKTSPPTSVWLTVKPLVNGGASGMLATCVIQPIDMIKEKIQLASTLNQKALCGLNAGAIGACVGSPSDLPLIRMPADATLPAAQRAVALNMGMLASYDQSVEFFRNSLDLGEAATVVGARTVSGFFISACSLPFD
ncbi:hypothetical protein ACH5RR_026173 [Cinchona calisaya]|uniref:Uncharacterized protein n=1 Tax=Cinchona calisaya TaxID=153742 RepID=A0ABD2Z1S1_9GENT